MRPTFQKTKEQMHNVSQSDWGEALKVSSAGLALLLFPPHLPSLK